MVKDLEKVKQNLSKKKQVEPQAEPPEQRQIHPLESNVIFREELLTQLGRIANALEVFVAQKIQNEKPTE